MSDILETSASIQELRILDLSLVDGNLRGELRVVREAGGKPLDLFWDESATSGTVHLLGECIRMKASQQVESSQRRYNPDFLGEAAGRKLYSWSEASLPGKMAVVVLPEGYSAGELKPLPTRIAEDRGRVVLVWERAPGPLAWTLTKADPNGVSSELSRLRSALKVSSEAQPRQRREFRVGRIAASVGALAATLFLGFSAVRLWVPDRTDSEGPEAGGALRGVRIPPAVNEVETGPIYARSFALVVGIDRYPSQKWSNLSYARHDAEGFAAFLNEQGFDKVYTLYDEEATKTAILDVMQSEIARIVQKEDRILVFFAGHGYTEQLGGKDWGYLVPADAEDRSATYISMEELQTQSEKMGLAKHQLFVLDACYGGLFAMRASGLDAKMPNYIHEITRRTARQVMTAGGSDQQVMDGGPGGHSVFTGHFLQAVREGLADNNSDGYVTFAELTGYVVPRASNRFQTPAFSSLPGHGNGEFVFKVLPLPVME